VIKTEILCQKTFRGGVWKATKYYAKAGLRAQTAIVSPPPTPRNGVRTFHYIDSNDIIVCLAFCTQSLHLKQISLRDSECKSARLSGSKVNYLSALFTSYRFNSNTCKALNTVLKKIIVCDVGNLCSTLLYSAHCFMQQEHGS
jgi:hypothetical protein